MKKQITIIVYDCADPQHSRRPDNLVEYLGWLHEKLAELPEEFRALARVSLFGFESCDSTGLNYTIEYDRLETDEEETFRMRSDEGRAKADLAYKKEMAARWMHPARKSMPAI